MLMIKKKDRGNARHSRRAEQNPRRHEGIPDDRAGARGRRVRSQEDGEMPVVIIERGERNVDRRSVFLFETNAVYVENSVAGA
ncbi:MAG: hypothetical protein ACLR06_06195 [Christensenellaceae bacterium]